MISLYCPYSVANKTGKFEQSTEIVFRDYNVALSADGAIIDNADEIYILPDARCWRSNTPIVQRVDYIHGTWCGLPVFQTAFYEEDHCSTEVVPVMGPGIVHRRLCAFQRLWYAHSYGPKVTAVLLRLIFSLFQREGPAVSVAIPKVLQASVLQVRAANRRCLAALPIQKRARIGRATGAVLGVSLALVSSV